MKVSYCDMCKQPQMENFKPIGGLPIKITVERLPWVRNISQEVVIGDLCTICATRVANLLNLDYDMKIQDADAPAQPKKPKKNKEENA